jgi:hypothetical protein
VSSALPVPCSGVSAAHTLINRGDILVSWRKSDGPATFVTDPGVATDTLCRVLSFGDPVTLTFRRNTV